MVAESSKSVIRIRRSRATLVGETLDTFLEVLFFANESIVSVTIVDNGSREKIAFPASLSDREWAEY